jgi:hypothetical protein
MSYDGVYVDPAVAGNGVRSWQAATDALQSQVSAKLAAISAAHAAAPWGGDSTGGEFSAAYLPSAENVAGGIPQGVTQLTELGEGAELAVQKSLDSDAVQATAVTIDVESGL